MSDNKTTPDPLTTIAADLRTLTALVSEAETTANPTAMAALREARRHLLRAAVAVELAQVAKAWKDVADGATAEAQPADIPIITPEVGVCQRHRPPARLHLTVRERVGGVRYVEIPKSHKDEAKFPDGTQVMIELADEPAIRVRAEVWGVKRRFATIKKKQEHVDRFEVGVDVVVMREEDV